MSILSPSTRQLAHRMGMAVAGSKDDRSEIGARLAWRGFLTKPHQPLIKPVAARHRSPRGAGVAELFKQRSRASAATREVRLIREETCRNERRRAYQSNHRQDERG